jgi:hypothetical protein
MSVEYIRLKIINIENRLTIINDTEGIDAITRKPYYSDAPGQYINIPKPTVFNPLLISDPTGEVTVIVIYDQTRNQFIYTPNTNINIKDIYLLDLNPLVPRAESLMKELIEYHLSETINSTLETINTESTVMKIMRDSSNGYIMLPLQFNAGSIPLELTFRFLYNDQTIVYNTINGIGVINLSVNEINYKPSVHSHEYFRLRDEPDGDIVNDAKYYERVDDDALDYIPTGDTVFNTLNSTINVYMINYQPCYLFGDVYINATTLNEQLIWNVVYDTGIVIEPLEIREQPFIVVLSDGSFVLNPSLEFMMSSRIVGGFKLKIPDQSRGPIKYVNQYTLPELSVPYEDIGPRSQLIVFTSEYDQLVTDNHIHPQMTRVNAPEEPPVEVVEVVNMDDEQAGRYYQVGLTDKQLLDVLMARLYPNPEKPYEPPSQIEGYNYYPYSEAVHVIDDVIILRREVKYDYKCVAGPPGTPNNVFFILYKLRSVDAIHKIYTIATYNEQTNQFEQPQ